MSCVNTPHVEYAIPTCDTILDLKNLLHNPKKLKKVIASLLRIFGWKIIKESDIEIKRISEALTNCVFFVTMRRRNTNNNRDKPSKVVLRVYCNGSDILFDRQRESLWSQRLSSFKIGPRLLGAFGNGRFEQFLESTTLISNDLRDPETSRQIARSIHRLHTMSLKFPPEFNAIPELWINIDRWYLLTLNLNYNEQEQKNLNVVLDHLDDDILQLKRILSMLNSPIVFAHNDAQCGNLLRLTDNPNQIIAVDYDYSGYNYRGFDFGNHFCEWMYDWHSSEPHYLNLDLYPTVEEQRNFLKAYLLESHTLDTLDKFDIEKLVVESNAFALASHLMWGLWGLVQSKQSDIKFNYFDYGIQRLTLFKNSDLKKIYSQIEQY